MRDVAVTGVQTCALPISWCAQVLRSIKGIPFVVTVHVEGIPSNRSRRLLSRWGDQIIAVSSDIRSDVARSEERRVGKECTPRWSPSRQKKYPIHSSRAMH